MKRLSTGLCLAALAGFGMQAGAADVPRIATNDTYTQEGAPTTNFGTSTTVLVRKDAANTLTRGGYFEFDLSGLPAGTITSARLQLFGSQDTGGTGVSIKALGGTPSALWNETALVYNNALTLSGVDFNGTPLATTTVSPPPSKIYEWNVTAYIVSRRSAGHATIGLGYTAANTYRATFNSSEATTNQPTLLVTVDTGGDVLPGVCPTGFILRTGTNTGFMHGGIARAFVLNVPSASTPLPGSTSAPPVGTPRPVWVALTGSVESTNEILGSRGGNAAMTSEGVIVIGPVRKCAGQDPNAASLPMNGGACNVPPPAGSPWNWTPWNEGRAFGAAGDPYKTNEGDDSKFLEAVVRCVAKTYPVDAKRIWVGGISSGGTMTNRALAFNSDFWAGGEPISGEWYVTRTDGTSYGANDFTARRAAANAAFNADAAANLEGRTILQGRVGPLPLYNTQGNTTQISPMIVITLWGGTADLYDCGNGLCADYRHTTQAGSNYFNAQPNVVHVACSSRHGHQWPTLQRDAWNRWVIRTLYKHPKGTPKSAFVLPPLGTLANNNDYICRVGNFTDHYPF